MSRRKATATVDVARIGVVVIATLLSLAIPTPSSALQQTVETRAAARQLIQARIDSLTPLMLRASERARAIEAARVRAEQERAVHGTDTMQIGPLRVVVLTGQGEVARPYFEKAWASYAPMLGGEAPERLSSQLFAFQRGLTIRELAVSRNVIPIYQRGWRPEATTETSVRNALGRALASTLPQPQALWIGKAPILLSPNLESAYRQLVVGVSATLDRCREGSLEACWSAMGETGAASLLEEFKIWYTPEQRRALVVPMTGMPRGYSFAGNRAGLSSASRDFMSVMRSCMEDLEGCETILQGTSDRDRYVPLGGAARATLAAVAIELGGTGAFHRFAEPLAAPADYRALIAKTAGVDADQVMAEWHRRVIAARPDRPENERRGRFGAVLWVLLFAAFSTRSTRWRLG